METIISKRQTDSEILHRKDVEVQYLERMREISGRRGWECSVGSWGYLQRRMCTKLQFQYTPLATYYRRNIVAPALGRRTSCVTLKCSQPREHGWGCLRIGRILLSVWIQEMRMLQDRARYRKEDLHKLHSSWDNIEAVKWRRMWWLKHGACVGTWYVHIEF